MTRLDVRDTVTDTAAAVLAVEPDTLIAADALTTVPTFNSFRIIEIVERLEESLEVEVDPADLVPDNLTRLSALAALFERATGAERA
jgi:acyl carrier protein